MDNNTENDMPALPSFMSENAEDGAESNNESWFAPQLHKVMTIVSALWFLLVGTYITMSFGWSNLFLMAPGEFGGFLAGITLPLAVIWVVVAYIDRGSEFKNEAKLLRAYMNQLVYPEEGAASTAKAMADAIREQVSELQDVTKLAMEKTEEIKTTLSTRVDDFAGLVKVLDDYSNKTINELNLGVSALIENCNFVTSQTQNMTDDFIKSAEKLKVQVGDLTVGMTPMLQDVRNMAIMLNDLTSDNQKKILSANEKFMEYSGLFRHLNESIAAVEQSIIKQREAVAEQAKVLEENSKYLDGKLGEYGRLINMEVEAMVNSTNTLDDNLQKHVSAIKGTASQIGEVFDGVYNEIERKNKKIAEFSKNNSESITKTAELFQNEIQQLTGFVKVADSQHNLLQDIAEKTADKLNGISSQIATNTDLLRTKAVETIDAFNEVSGNLKKNTQNMLEASSQIAAQAKKGNDALVAQSEKFITYAKQVESTKNSLQNISDVLTSSTEQVKNALDTYKNEVTSLQQSVDTHIKSAEEAGKKSFDMLQKFENRYSEASIASFLKDSEVIMSKLENIAVDINHILSPEDEEGLWKKYYAGDKSAFIRYLAKTLTKKQIVAIHDEYEKNADFREITDRYLDGFDRMIASAKESTQADMLLAMLYSSHIGKVYYIIARALNKVE